MNPLNLFSREPNPTVLAAGDTLFNEGDPGEEMYVVLEGEIDIFVKGTLVATVGPGGIIGEMALVDHLPRAATVKARTDAKLASINERRFTFLVQNTPFFAIHVMRVLAQRLRHMDALLRPS
jgi:CRP/FNR family transcriptional regulator, cyclic AMP receptor protein